MKQVTRCYNCKNIIRVAGSFKAQIEEPQVINGMEFNDAPKVKKVISLCRKCAGIAGYKVKPDYKVVFDTTRDPNNPFTNKVK